MGKKIRRTILLVVAFAFYDALIGGGISAAINASGKWIQPINDVYQFGFGIVILTTLLVAAFKFNWRKEALAALVMLLGLVEDTLFYFFIPIANPFINLITDGASYVPKGGKLYPETISAWFGWIGRIFGDTNLSLSLGVVFVLNLIAIITAILILSRKDKPPVSIYEYH